jgi:Domain of unknown function (DUF5047)
MLPVSNAFLLTLRDSHLISSAAELYFPDSLAAPVSVPVLAGRVTIDRTAQIRRTGSLTIPWSMNAKDLLGGVDIRTLPLGGYVIVKRGILFPDASSELVTLGWLRCESVNWSETESRATIELADSMAQLRDEPFQTPFVASGMQPAQAAQQIVYEVFGANVSYEIRFDPPITLADVTYSGSRLDALFALAKAAGAETYFDADGNWIFDVAPGTVAYVKTGTIADGSAVITGLTPGGANTELFAGMTVTGTGIPVGRRIASVNSSTQITMDGVAVISVTPRQGYCDTRWYSIWQMDLAGLSPGMGVSGPNLPAGTTITAVYSDQISISKLPIQTGSFLVTFTPAPTSTALTFAGKASAYPVWTIDAGDRGVLIDVSESLDRTGTYNGVLVTGQADAESPEFDVLVTDSVPTSPTRWGGPFGHVVRKEDSKAVQTVAQAQAMGGALLNEGLGLARSLTITTAPNPALVPGDTVTIVFDEASGDDVTTTPARTEQHIIDAMDISLGTESVRLATRSTEKPEDLQRFAPFSERAKVYIGADVWSQLRDKPVFQRVRERVY